MEQTTARSPKALVDAVRYYADLDRCQEVMVAVRWPDGVVKCPTCGSDRVSYIATRRLWECREKPRHAKRQFSVKVGTIFEDSPLGLDKWLPAVWLIANCKSGVSSHELGRALGVTQKSAWFMLHRIRHAMKTGTFEKLKGTVEADETFVGGKVTNMHKHRRQNVGKHYGRTIVLGMVERGDIAGERTSKVRAQVVGDNDKRSLLPVVRQTVAPGSEIFTDAFGSYRDLQGAYIHDFVDHTVEYVHDQVHTNGIENFWSLLKRTIRGTYVSVRPFHLGRYVDEQAFRFNGRRGDDGLRFLHVLGTVTGRRLTYKVLTGKTLRPATA